MHQMFFGEMLTRNIKIEIIYGLFGRFIQEDAIAW